MLSIFKVSLIYIGIMFLILVFLTPFLWMGVTAFKPEGEIFSKTFMPSYFTISNFYRLFSLVPFFRYYINSLIITVPLLTMSLFFSSMAGFAFAGYDFPLKSFLFTLSLSTIMIPFYVLLIPRFILIVHLKLVDSYLALILPGLISPMGVFFVRQYIIQSVPLELLDSARIDGCSEFKIFWQIILPLIKPALSALAIFTFIGAWNDFLWPFIVIKTQWKFTLPLGLQNLYGTYGLEYGPVMAGTFLVVVPIIILYVLLQKEFIRGLTLGAIKG